MFYAIAVVAVAVTQVVLVAVLAVVVVAITAAIIVAVVAVIVVASHTELCCCGCTCGRVALVW